jgi:hypothetical protein
MFDYPPDIRRLIYTTNTIEGEGRQLRKVTKTKGAFPTLDRGTNEPVVDIVRYGLGLGGGDLLMILCRSVVSSGRCTRFYGDPKLWQFRPWKPGRRY